MNIIKEFYPEYFGYGTCVLKSALHDRDALIKEARKDFPRLLPRDITDVLFSEMNTKTPIVGIRFAMFTREEALKNYRTVTYPEVLR